MPYSVCLSTILRAKYCLECLFTDLLNKHLKHIDGCTLTPSGMGVYVTYYLSLYETYTPDIVQNIYISNNGKLNVNVIVIDVLFGHSVSIQ